MHTLAYALTSYGLWILAPILYRIHLESLQDALERGFKMTTQTNGIRLVYYVPRSFYDSQLF